MHVFTYAQLYVNLKNIPPREPRGIEIGPSFSAEGYNPAIKNPLFLDTTLLIKFVKRAAGRWFSQYTPPIKQDSHDITEILLKVALNTITTPI
jgi:hypothetical protein